MTRVLNPLFKSVCQVFPVICLGVMIGGTQVSCADQSAERETSQTELLGPERQREIVDRIVEMLDEVYVFPEIARKCGRHLTEQLEQGAFAELTDPEEFAGALTKMLRSVSNDKHLLVRVRIPKIAEIKDKDPIAARLMAEDEMRRRNFAFKAVEIMEGNVGYVDMRAFQPAHLARDTIASTMGFLANSDAIIFDMRNNHGGFPETVQLLCSYFFKERTHLNSLYFREGDRTIEFWTLDEIPGRRMPDVPLFVLTSSRTFSGAEEFCYNLRTRNRATLIGEITRGGANPGQLRSIDSQFEIIIPMGRAINPVTKTNWDGTGVEPHISVNAEKALDVALPKARKAAKEFLKVKTSRLTIWNDVQNQLRTASEKFQDGMAEDAMTIIREALEKGLDGKVLNEGIINMLGYRRLQSSNFEDSIAIFRFNTDEFPKSANVWDSLAEAYMKSSRPDLAIQHYEKSLSLDPTNTNAKKMIDKLKQKSDG